METMKDPEDYVGCRVVVTPTAADDFLNEFEGEVIGVRDGFLKVRDEDDDVWCVEIKQVHLA